MQKINKKINKLILITFIFISLSSFAQNKVDYEINSDIFSKKTESLYMSEDNKATLIVVAVPFTFEEIMEDPRNNTSEGFLGENVETGFIEGTEIYYIQEPEDRNGEMYFILLFMKKGSDNKTINVMSGFPLKDKELYYPIVLETAKSAKMLEE